MPKRLKRPHNRYITINQQLASSAANTDGGFTESESEYWKCWATAWPIRGNEPAAMEHLQAITEWIVKMRFCTKAAGINAKMWIILPGGERLNITSVFDPDGRRREIQIRARQVA